MSAALVQLVSKGVQDVYITSNTGASLFSLKYKRHTNFSQAPKLIKTITSPEDNIIKIPVYGDLLNALWFEGEGMITKFQGARFDLYIGGTKIDSQPFDYISDIWQNYLSENFVKAMEIINNVSVANNHFIPLHFFFCDNGMYLPLIALQHHEVEIRIEFREEVTGVKCYGNYIFLDTDERNKFANASMDIIISQVQQSQHEITQNETTLDLSTINHPVKSLFFGFSAKDPIIDNDYLTFETADMYINGTVLFEDMSPLYFHIVQNYYNSQCGIINYVEDFDCPMYTRYYVYHFCKDASQYKPTGTCNFSRLDNAKIILKNITRGANRIDDNYLNVYAVSYNVLRIKEGMAGILFAN